MHDTLSVLWKQREGDVLRAFLVEQHRLIVEVITFIQ